MEYNPSRFNIGDNYPVEKVSWNEANRFIEELIRRSDGHHRFRLPSEAEWEYACRSRGKLEKYAGSEDVNDVAWYRVNSGGSTHPVGQRQPNGLGIYDMSGNVWEWCNDIYVEDAYSKHEKNNPVSKGSGPFRVPRGGSWAKFPGGVRCANRPDLLPGVRYYTIGLRLVRTD